MSLLITAFLIIVVGIAIYAWRMYTHVHHSYIYTLIPLPTHFSAQNTIIIFDLHRVVFIRDFKKTFSCLFTWVDGMPFMFHFAKPKILKYALSLSRRDGSDEEFLEFLYQHYPQLIKYKPNIKELVSAYYPNKEMPELIQLLKNKGYTVHVASNIGSTFVDGITSQYPEIFKNFDVIKTVVNKNDGNPLHVKPSLGYFQEYIDQYNHNGKLMIFIDNNSKNLETCAQAGMIGIRFENAQQLKKQLEELGIL